jgi:hypothetical protein
MRDDSRPEDALLRPLYEASPPPDLWQRAMAPRPGSRLRWPLGLGDPARPRRLHRPLVAALAMSVVVGVAGAAVGLHSLNEARPGTAGGASQPASSSAPSASAIGRTTDMFTSLASSMIGGPGPSCVGAVVTLGTDTKPFIGYIERAPEACAGAPSNAPAVTTTPGPAGSSTGGGLCILSCSLLTRPPVAVGTYVVHVDSCGSRSAKAVTVTVDPKGQHVVQETDAPYGEAVDHRGGASADGC